MLAHNTYFYVGLVELSQSIEKGQSKMSVKPFSGVL